MKKLKQIATAVVLAFAVMFIVSPAALAAETSGEAPAVVFTISPAIVVQILLAVVLPIVVGLVTTQVTSSSAKAWLLAGLTAVTSLVVELGRSIATDTPYDLGLALLAVFPAFAISVATHYGLWKPTGASEKVQAIGSK